MARLFDKDVSKAIGLIKAAHTSFYGDQPLMDAQMTQYFSGNKRALVTPVTVDGKNGVSTDYPHLYDEATVSEEFLNSVNAEIENAIINIRNGNLDKVPDVIGVTELSSETVKKISDFVGFDISGYTCKIEKDRLIHIENRHGINGNHDHSLSDPKDVARMGYAVNHSDNISWVVDDKGNRVFDTQYNNKNNKPSPVILLSCKIDGTYCVGQAVPDSKKKTLWITSARIQKADVGSQVPNADNSPQPTSETPLVSSSASDNIVSQEKDVVNSSIRSDSENNTRKGVSADKENVNNPETLLKNQPTSDTINEKNNDAFKVADKRETNSVRYSIVDGNGNVSNTRKILHGLSNKSGIKYNNGQVIRIPDGDMRILRHAYKTEEHYSNRSDGILDCISCSGSNGKKHYFYVFYNGEHGNVAPIFRLNYTYLDKYIDAVRNVLYELGVDESDVITRTERVRSELEGIRDFNRGVSSNADATSGGNGAKSIGGAHRGQSGRRGDNNRQFDSGVSIGRNERASDRRGVDSQKSLTSKGKESEEQNERGSRNILYHASGKRQNGTSAGESFERVDGRTRRYKEGQETKNERREYCKTLKADGVTRERIIYGHKADVIPAEHYMNSEEAVAIRMKKNAESNKKQGIDETIFTVGEISIPFVKDSNGKPKTADGMYVSHKGKKTVVVQFDSYFHMPEQINDHEKVHDSYKNERTQNAKKIIWNTLSADAKRNVLHIIQEDYAEIIDGREEELFEEVVADILSGMHIYSDTFHELIKAYWNKEDSFIKRWEYETETRAFKRKVPTKVSKTTDVRDAYVLPKNAISFPVNSEANTLAMQWAHDVDVEEGEKEIVFFHDDAYLIEKVNTSESEKYRIVKQIKEGEYTKWKEKYGGKRNGENIGKQSRRGRTGNIGGENRGHPSYGGEARSSNRDSDRHNGEAGSVSEVDRGEHGRGQVDSDGETDYDTGIEDRPDVLKYSLAEDTDYILQDLETEEDYEKAIEQLIERYGRLKSGENPVRDIVVPKKIAEDKPVSQFARTMMEAEVTPDETVSEFEKAILDGTMTHEVITDKAAEQKAIDKIKDLGFEEALRDWEGYVRDGVVSKEQLVLGMVALLRIILIP